MSRKTTDFTFKIIVAGPGGVGKTTLLKRYESGKYIPATMTVGINFIVKQFEYAEGVLILSIWDYAGEERFKAMFPGYCRGAAGALACFDTTRPDTLHVLLDSWVGIIKEKAPNVPILLVGTKVDSVSTQEIEAHLNPKAKEYAQKAGLQGPYWTSSKTGNGINEIFESLSYQLRSQIHK